MYGSQPKDRNQKYFKVSVLLYSVAVSGSEVMSELFDVTVLNTAWMDSTDPYTDGNGGGVSLGGGSVRLYSWLSMGLFA
ncbi:hypothetical protein [Vibrio nomapromontoriensis]|uniref:hypothetical protein n=1 Tax=Vibrio nomapromontoriensis TaxID=2910246 RepID=UPI003D0DFACC